MTRARNTVAAAALLVCAGALVACAPSATPGSGSVFGGSDGATLAEAFPILQTDATDIDALPPGSDIDLGLDPGSTRYLTDVDGIDLWIGTKDDGSALCGVAIPTRAQGAGMSSCSTPRAPDAVSGMVVGWSSASSPTYGLWSIDSDTEATRAGWMKLTENLWTR